MIGHPKHVAKALDAGVDIICAQGGEAGVTCFGSALLLTMRAGPHRRDCHQCTDSNGG